VAEGPRARSPAQAPQARWRRAASGPPRSGGEAAKIGRLADLLRPGEELRALRERVRALQGPALVAARIPSVSHEVSAPLGSLASLADVNLRCVDRIRSVLASAASLDEVRHHRQLNRALNLLEENSRAAHDAAARALQLILNVRGFLLPARDVAAAPLTGLLDQTLLLFHDEFVSGVEVVRDYACAPVLSCRPVALKTAFLFLIGACAERLAVPGILRVRVYQEAESIRVDLGANEGQPLAAEVRDRLIAGQGLLTDPSEAPLVLAQEILREEGGKLDFGSPSQPVFFSVQLPESRL